MTNAGAEPPAEPDRRATRGVIAVWLCTAAMAAATVALLWIVNAKTLSVTTGVRVPWWVLAIGFAATEARALNLRFRSESYTCTLAELVLVIGFFTTSPNGIVLAQVAASVFALAFITRQPIVRGAFNIAQSAFTTVIAILVFNAVAGVPDATSPRTWVAAVAGVLSLVLASFLIVAFAITVTRGRPRGADLLMNASVASLAAIVNAMLGLIVVIQFTESPVSAVLLIAPVLTVFFAFRAYVSERTKRDSLQFLYTATETLNQGRDLETGLLALLAFARENFCADVAEIVLHGEPGDQFGFRTASGPGTATSSLEPVAAERVQEIIEAAAGSEVTEHAPEPGSELAERAGVRMGSVLIASLEDESGVRGAVLLARGVDEEPFEPESVQLFETFANHLTLSLENERLTSSLERLREAEQEFAYQAYHDSLTGLANRALFRDRVDAAIAESEQDGSRICLMFIDLDDFKMINDTKGHAIGDALLTAIGGVLAHSVGSRDTAARLGGDEFALLLRDVAHISQVHLIANSIIKSLRTPMDIDGEQLSTRASIGVALHADGTGAAELMQQADLAMYSAKRRGKGRFEEFRDDMNDSAAQRYEVKAGLERAVSDHEFTLDFQPVMDIASGVAVGAEALLRWKDPQRGMQQPPEFVEVAEETGLIVPIGRIVIQEACRQAIEWTREFPDLRVFVNLSARELAHPDIVHEVQMALVMSGLAPRHLVLEVNETALLPDVDESKKRLHELKDLGIGLAIDDFGTGVSSLSYLRELPIDVLKIAKPTIDAIGDSPEDAAFVRGIVELGHVVGATVVAEGVEKVEQHSQATAIGCDLAQGYYYAQPMAGEQLTRMLRTSAEARELFGRLGV
jgi:diguanylate cyclase (GGDEF)-like protein